MVYQKCRTRGSGGSFKDRKHIGEVGCRDAWMPERTHSRIDRWFCLWVSESLSLWVSESLSLSLSVSFSSLSMSVVFICLSVWLAGCLSIWLSVCLSVCLSISLSIHLSLSLSRCIFVIYLSIHPSIYLSTYLYTLRATKHLKNTVFGDLSTFSHTLIFFLLALSSLTLSLLWSSFLLTLSSLTLSFLWLFSQLLLHLSISRKFVF